MKLTKPLVILDLETTGTLIEKDKIVEIGMVLCLPDGSRQNYVRRVNPGIKIPKRISEIIAITDEDVRNAPAFKEIAAEASAFIGSSDLAGFNLERFDLPVLEREMAEAGVTFSWRDRTIYDAQKIYHIHERRDLVAAYLFYCGKQLENAHSALSDAEATLKVLEAQIKKYGGGDDKIEALGEFEYEETGEYFDAGKKFRWWNGELYPTFGRYGRRRSLKDIAQKDRAYLEWILSADFGSDVKALAADALSGRFPKHTEHG